MSIRIINYVIYGLGYSLDLQFLTWLFSLLWQFDYDLRPAIFQCFVWWMIAYRLYYFAYWLLRPSLIDRPWCKVLAINGCGKAFFFF